MRAHSYVYYAAKNPVDFVVFNYTFPPEGGSGVAPPVNFPTLERLPPALKGALTRKWDGF